LVPKWYQDLGFLPTHPVISGGLVFVIRKDGRTIARDEQSGKVIWVSRTRGRPATVDKGRLVHYGNRVSILDATTGRVRKVLDGPGAMSAAWVEDTLAVQTFRNPSWRLYTASPDTGKTIWEHRFPEASSHPEGPSFRISACFAATPERVVCGLSEGAVLALALRDGELLWERSVADLAWELIDRGMKPGEAHGAIVLYDDLALLEVLGGHVAALRVETGERAWVWYEGPSLSECYLYGDVYYAHNGGGRIYAIDPKRGRTLRSFELYARMPVKARMAIGEIGGPFLVSETHFFTGSSTGYIAAFDREDGRYVWSDRPRGNRGCTYYNGNYFMAVNGRLYYGDQSFGIHCWEEDKPKRAYSVGSKSRGSAAGRSPFGSKDKKPAARPGKGG
jgi:outer membrane protein assembly factor BamB